MNLPVQNRSTGSIVLALLLGLAAVFTLPYFVPVHDGISYSYMFGYNNRAALLILLAFGVAFALWSRSLALTLPNTSLPSKSFAGTAYTFIALAILGSTLVWIVSLPIAPMGEAQYFIDRYEMYRLLGPPYKAFTFYYGPIMFYLPVWISRIGHLSIANSYFLALTAEWGLGTWFLWQTIKMAARGTEHGRAIFLFFWFFFLASLLGSGSQYTPMRFCPGLFFALATYQLYRRGTSILLTFATAVLGVVATLFFSPEQGIAFILATFAFFLFCIPRRRPQTMAGIAGFAVAVAVLILIAIKIGELDTLTSIGGGALNFPILANSHTVFLLLLLIIAVCVIVGAFQKKIPDHPLVYLICISFFTLPAAMSRADIGHIVINTLGALIAVLVVLSQYPSVWRWLRIALVLFAALLLNGVKAYRPILRDEYLRVALGTQFHSDTAQKLLTRAVTFVDGSRAASRLQELKVAHDLSETPGQAPLPPGTHLFAPQGIQRRMTPYPNQIEIITGRSVYPMTNAEVIQEKIDMLRSHPDWPLLLTANKEANCQENPDGARKGLKESLGVPYIPPPKHIITAALPLCRYINANYAAGNAQSPVPGFFVWFPKNGKLDRKSRRETNQG